MSRIVIVGAGMGGLVSGLMLSRRGHEVIVCERDAEAVPSDPDSMWSDWSRPGTPQARLGHTFLAGARRMLAERLPDVLDAVLAAGAQCWDMASAIPASERRPDDAELVSIMARRPVFEGVLRRIAESEATVEIRRGCLVSGLIAEPSRDSCRPRVIGVAVRDGTGIAADVVIVSGGRSLPIRRWFQAIGATSPPEQSDGCGCICYTRYFRVKARIGEDDGTTTQLTYHHDPGYAIGEMIGADRRTFAVELIVPVNDRAFRGLRDVATWMAAARAVTGWAEWIDPARAEPITSGVAIMGQEHNTYRRFVDAGRPLALGVHVIGDARCQTDSLFAWGCANVMLTSAALVDVLAEHANDLEAQALAFETRVEQELLGRFEYSQAWDRAWHQATRGEDPDPARRSRIVDEVILPAVDHNTAVLRAFRRWDMQLDPVDGLEHDTSIIERAQQVRGETHATSPEPFPSRDELLAAMTSAL
jgi:2-polyprenyl-6-methoxyphenol hydroxylase-like FAD-dependent oxidoreductase